jgi:tryptophan synthase beta chain
MSKNDLRKVLLEESEIPKFWYNISADMPNKMQGYYNPQTNLPLGPNDMDAIFPKGVIEQEMSQERYIEIPAEIRELYKAFRPSPLFRAKALEKALGTPAKIFYKYEGGNTTGSHKLNTALPQAYYNKIAGIKRITTETGAGQWGIAISLASSMFGMDTTVYMVKVSYNQKPQRRLMMEMLNSKVFASPSVHTEAGRMILAKDPESTGSLGIAISEAVEDAATHADANYSLGSVLNHVCIHQSVIGLEAKKQMEVFDEYPDVVIACCGGGSNFAGIAFPFMKDKIEGKKIRFIAAEPQACPTLTKGVFAYDYGDTAKMAPITMMYTLGHDFVPEGIHSGGLRYHGDSPLISQLYHDGFIEAKAFYQTEVFDAASLFLKTEGILPAPESSHAIKAAIDEAVLAKQEGASKNILFSLSGNGYFDMTAYQSYFEGNMKDVEFNAKSMEESLLKLPKV